ncbi:tyrosine-type recombinase/integrase [Blautia sp.]|uniref:tyrosine-type recombinase/integrase n=1 Tax=Blautia sp. TaxID=1955243 RepID=UPI003AB8DFD3
MAKIKMTIANDLTFTEGCEEYFLDCKARNLRKDTVRHYKDSSKQIMKYIGEDILIKDIDKEVIDNFIIQMQENPKLNDMSLYTYARDFKTLMYFFMRKEYIPTFKIKIPKADKQPVETYSDRELQVLLKKPNLRQCTFTEYKVWVMTNFLLSTGVRQRSLINIKIKDLDIGNSVVYINVTKNRKPLIIPLNKDIKRILQEYLKYRKGEAEDYLFCNVFGKQLVRSTVYHSFYEYNKSRGIEKTGMHRYRHTFAKKWVLAGGNVVTLQKILGHSSLDTTQNYLNLLVSDIQKEIEEFNILQEFKRESIKMNC